MRRYTRSLYYESNFGANVERRENGVARRRWNRPSRFNKFNPINPTSYVPAPLCTYACTYALMHMPPIRRHDVFAFYKLPNLDGSVRSSKLWIFDSFRLFSFSFFFYAEAHWFMLRPDRRTKVMGRFLRRWTIPENVVEEVFRERKN